MVPNRSCGTSGCMAAPLALRPCPGCPSYGGDGEAYPNTFGRGRGVQILRSCSLSVVLVDVVMVNVDPKHLLQVAASKARGGRRGDDPSADRGMRRSPW